VIYRVPSNFPGAGRRVYPGFLQHTGFVAMNPSNHAKSHWDYFKDLVKGDGRSVEAHRKFYDEYNAVLDMDAVYYLQTIQTVFQDFKLVNGTWDVVSPEGKTERVRPQDIAGCALLTVEGELDDISGSGQTRAAHDLCSGITAAHKQHFEAAGAGHYGIFSGRRWREVVYPVVEAFILKAHQAGSPRVASKPAAKPAVKPAAQPSAKPAAKAASRVAKPSVKPSSRKPAPAASKATPAKKSRRA
jgi:poly(3-hydroxybutyrate) depolymerase